MRDVANSSVPSHVPPTFDLDNAGISYSSVITLLSFQRLSSMRLHAFSSLERGIEGTAASSLTNFVINGRDGILARFDSRRGAATRLGPVYFVKRAKIRVFATPTFSSRPLIRSEHECGGGRRMKTSSWKEEEQGNE